MVVYDLDVFRTCVRPPKTHPKWVVHTDAVLADPIALQRLQPIAGRYPQIIQSRHDLQLAQFSTSNGCDRGESLDPLPICKGSRVSAFEGPDHALIVTLCMINVKRGYCRDTAPSKFHWQADEPQDVLAQPGAGAQGRGDIASPCHAQQGDGQIAQRCHHLGAGTFANAAAVFIEGDIAHPVQSVFDGPMTAA